MKANTPLHTGKPHLVYSGRSWCVYRPGHRKYATGFGSTPLWAWRNYTKHMRDWNKYLQPEGDKRWVTR